MPWQIHESALMINACLLMPGGRQMKLDRLSALDETYVVAETDEAPLHIGALALFSGRTLLNEHGHLRLTALRLHMENRLVEVPRFRRRLERNPLDGGHFFWTDDESFDIANHVHTMTLPPRGRSRRSEERRLLDFCAELVRPRLDRSKPLWEVTFVTGLRGNRVALVEKVHHALVDGVGGVGVLNVLLEHDRTTNEPDRNAKVDDAGWEPEAVHFFDLAKDAVAQRLRSFEGVVDLVASPVHAVQSAVAMVDGVATFLAGGVIAPRCSLRAQIGAERTFHICRLSLSDVKIVKTVSHTTVNDVVLATMTGALRTFLLERGDRVDDLTLQALIPVNIRSTQDTQVQGNRTALLQAPLPLGVVDPIDQLRTVAAAMDTRKGHHQAAATGAALSLAALVPTIALGPLSHAIIDHQHIANLLITNVPGPTEPLYLLGAQMIDTFGFAPLAGMMTVSVAVTSYKDHLTFGINADSVHCPDGAVLAAAITKSFAQLHAALVPVIVPDERR